MTITIPPELEKSVRQQAAKAGQDVTTFVVEAVTERLAKQQQATQAPTGSLAALIDEIRRGQQARGYPGRSAEEIEAVRQEGEADYERRIQSARRGQKTGE
jgi:hypothetical protein